jgi:zinc D-Ala-D-Ala carboxypeptidase
MTTKISPHFTLDELTETSFRQYDNTPGTAETAALKLLANECLEKIRAKVGPMRINSAYRSPDVNKAVGGSPTSQHCRGEAADWTAINMKLKDTMKEVLKLHMDGHLVFDQLIYEFGRWLHISYCDPKVRKPRGQVLMIGSWTGGKYLPYDEGKIP